MRTRWARLSAGVGAATLSLLAASTTGAQAVPAADPVDVETRQYFDHDTTLPGGSIGVRAIAELMTGQVSRLSVTVTLPQGVTYVRTSQDGADAVCTPSADGRTVTCASKDGKSDVSAYVLLKAGADLAPGTALTFTTTADIGDAVDTKPENNTATGKVTVRQPADLGVKWKAPSGAVTVGKDVKTELVVTNHGPGPVRLEAVHFGMGWDYWPEPGYDKDCWADPGVLICDVFKDLAPGDTVTLPFTWNFPKKAAGTTYRVPASLYSPSPYDPNRANDKDTLVFTIAKASPTTLRPTATSSSKPSPAPTTTSEPTSSPTPTATSPSATAPAGGGSDATPQGGGGRLAESGAGPVTAAAAGATALTLTGGALVLLRNRSRRREHGTHA